MRRVDRPDRLRTSISMGWPSRSSRAQRNSDSAWPLTNRITPARSTPTKAFGTAANRPRTRPPRRHLVPLELWEKLKNPCDATYRRNLKPRPVSVHPYLARHSVADNLGCIPI